MSRPAFRVRALPITIRRERLNHLDRDLMPTLQNVFFVVFCGWPGSSHFSGSQASLHKDKNKRRRLQMQKGGPKSFNPHGNISPPDERMCVWRWGKGLYYLVVHGSIRYDLRKTISVQSAKPCLDIGHKGCAPAPCFSTLTVARATKCWSVRNVTILESIHRSAFQGGDILFLQMGFALLIQRCIDMM